MAGWLGLHRDVLGLQWMVDSYALVFADMLVTAGSLGDRFGRRRGPIIGLVIFSCGSLLAAMSSSASEVIAGRAVMGPAEDTAAGSSTRSVARALEEGVDVGGELDEDVDAALVRWVDEVAVARPLADAAVTGDVCRSTATGRPRPRWPPLPRQEVALRRLKCRPTLDVSGALGESWARPRTTGGDELYHDVLGWVFTSPVGRTETSPGCLVMRCSGSGCRTGLRRTQILPVGTVGWTPS